MKLAQFATHYHRVQLELVQRDKHLRLTHVLCMAALTACILRTFQADALAQCVSLPAGAVSWWQAEDNASDYLGINHGVLLNGLGFAAGKIGRAFNFTPRRRK